MINAFFIKLYNKLILFYLKFFFSNSLQLGEDISFRGIPIITCKKGSLIKIGSKARIVSKSRYTALGVSHPTILRTQKEAAKIEIGSVFRASGVSICADESVTIGENVVVGSGAIITDTDFHSLNPAQRSSAGDRGKSAPVQIGSNVFIGANAIILKGVTVGAGAVVGAGSVVTKNIPPGSICAGNPAKVIRLLNE